MASGPLVSLLVGLREIAELRRVYPTIRGPLPVARAVGRAAVVLLSGHFERYFYAVNEEASGYLNGSGVTRAAIPPEVRLAHSRLPIDVLAGMEWTRRTAKLEAFVESDAWLWRDGVVGNTDHERLLSWMKSPDSENLIRFYRQWGIVDVFTATTRTVRSRARMFLAVRELVDKRNNIAHGDVAAEASRGDVGRYLDTVRTFCSRADGVFGRQLARLSGGPVPW